jgi:AbrB family looped-hinge helix DNA binding protein
MHSVVVGDRGRLVIPVELRDRAGFTEGTTLVLVETARGVLVMTRSQLRDLVREDIAGLDLVGDLLADRQSEAKAEAAA